MAKKWPDLRSRQAEAAANTPPNLNRKILTRARHLQRKKTAASVYVKGTYSASKSLTIAAEERSHHQRQHLPYERRGNSASAPTGTDTLGLIATRYVRIYHPCTTGRSSGNGRRRSHRKPLDLCSDPARPATRSWSTTTTAAQRWETSTSTARSHRSSAASSDKSAARGYNKEYNYDERLATDEPPYFLAPLKAGWKIARETAPDRRVARRRRGIVHRPAAARGYGRCGRRDSNPQGLAPTGS